MNMNRDRVQCRAETSGNPRRSAKGVHTAEDPAPRSAQPDSTPPASANPRRTGNPTSSPSPPYGPDSARCGRSIASWLPKYQATSGTGPLSSGRTRPPRGGWLRLIPGVHRRDPRVAERLRAAGVAKRGRSLWAPGVEPRGWGFGGGGACPAISRRSSAARPASRRPTTVAVEASSPSEVRKKQNPDSLRKAPGERKAKVS